MFTFIANIPIARRLLYAFLLATIIPCIIIFLLSAIFTQVQNVQIQAIQTTTNLVRATNAAQQNLQNINEQLNKAYQDQYDYAAAPTPGLSVNKPILESQFDDLLKTYQQQYLLATAPQMSIIKAILVANNPAMLQQATFNQIQASLWPDYKKAYHRLLQAIDNKIQREQALLLLQQTNQKYQALRQSWLQLQQVAEEATDSVAHTGPLSNSAISLATTIALFSTTLLIAAIGYLIYLTITRPLNQLSMLTTRIARGETNARANIMGRDEIQVIAASMNNMLDNIVHLIQETQSQRDTLQAQVEKLVSEVSGVGEGDLRVQAEVTADALGVLADSFNYMVEELGSLVVRVKIVAHEVENSTTAILDRMTQLVETGDIQISQIAEAVVEVERMASSSHQVAERSQILYDVARMARQNAQTGREAVVQSIEGMGRIKDNVHTTASKVQTLGERSREINEIVEAISGIVHQTNRLALDAAIQAAMAGEHGKGFGAVAADIRRLAERAKDQASMITRIVRSVREDIGSVALSMQDTQRETLGGTRLTQEAGVALESIFAAVEHQAREIENINHMAVQQLQSSSAVVQIMRNVSQSTQQNSGRTRDASQNMERLTRLVEQLRASVEAFKLRNNQSQTSSTSSTGINRHSDEEEENPLTVSGVFRTVTATTVPPQQLLPTTLRHPIQATETTINDPFSFYPTTPYQPASDTWGTAHSTEESRSAYSTQINQHPKG